MQVVWAAIAVVLSLGFVVAGAAETEPGGQAEANSNRPPEETPYHILMALCSDCAAKVRRSHFELAWIRYGIEKMRQFQLSQQNASACTSNCGPPVAPVTAESSTAAAAAAAPAPENPSYMLMLP